MQWLFFSEAIRGRLRLLKDIIFAQLYCRYSRSSKMWAGQLVIDAFFLNYFFAPRVNPIKMNLIFKKD